MIDIHTHIAPQMDDGARNVDEALKMLQQQRSCGVTGVYLTPHYDPDDTELPDFLERRRVAWETLQKDLPDYWCGRIRVGAEVRLSQHLLGVDVRQLTLEQSDYLLLELPRTRYPAYAQQVVTVLQEKGVIPILAHVERYSYFREEPSLLKRLINAGAVGQVSANAVFAQSDKGFAKACLTHDLAQVAASDAHDSVNRIPCMDLLSKLPMELQQRMEQFAQAVWDNEAPLPVRPELPKRFFGSYR